MVWEFFLSFLLCDFCYPRFSRTELNLPAPQVSDSELQELAKMTGQAQAHVRLETHVIVCI